MAGALKGLGFLLKHPILTTAGVAGAAHFATGGKSTDAVVDGAKDLASGGLKDAFGGLGDMLGGVGDFFKDNPLTSLAAAGAGLFGTMKGGWMTGIVSALGVFAVSYLAQKMLFKNEFNNAAQGPQQGLHLTADQQAANQRTFDPKKIEALDPNQMVGQSGADHVSPAPAQTRQGPELNLE